MKTILEYLYNRKRAIISNKNRFNITEKDLIGDLKGFPLGVVVRMLEETEMQGKIPNVNVFQKRAIAWCEIGGFSWDDTEAGKDFWSLVLAGRYDLFYEKYPEYKKYDS